MTTDRFDSGVTSTRSTTSRQPSRGILTLLFAPLIAFGFLLLLLYVNRIVRLHLLISTLRVTTSQLQLYHGLWLIGIAIASLLSAWFVSKQITSRCAPTSALINGVGATFSLIMLLSCAPFCGWLAIIAEPDMGLVVPLPGYQIMLFQGYTSDADFAYLRLQVTRSDGERYTTDVGGGVTRACTSLTTNQRDTRIYFQCNDEPITEQTAYVDIERRVLYVGHKSGSPERALDALPFESP